MYQQTWIFTAAFGGHLFLLIFTIAYGQATHPAAYSGPLLLIVTECDHIYFTFLVSTDELLNQLLGKI